jgi:hypothetical protein
MGNNKEIRQRMETYRIILLVMVWIVAIAGVIGGFVMIGYETGGGWSGSSHPLRPYGIGLLIVSILGGIIGHFLVNVGLAIPFILLNNGDYLAAIVPEGKVVKSAVSSDEPLKDEPSNKTKIESKEKIHQEIETTVVKKTNTIKIQRIENVVGSAMLVDIKIDDNINLSLKNGEEKIVDVANGNHTLLATFDNGSDRKSFLIDNDKKSFSIIIEPPVKIIDSPELF